MLFRIGIHLGDVIVEGDDIHGDGVNIAARLEGLAEAGGYVDAIAMDVLSLDDDVAKVNPDAKKHLSTIGFAVLPCRHIVLYIRRTLDGIDDTAELDQEAVTHGLDEAAPVVGDGRFDDLVETPIELCPRAGLVLPHQSAVTDHVSREYRGQPSLDSFLGH